ncbi:LacI family transcriptional regulator [Tropicimonas sp. IMCC34043]|uniref:LacI family transcriptional regulator n=1 Tax=Tropicimonas sp. IMCC34043 TaxID=2248760 RepID=UPI000E279373|nr:LacI family transcriptional regulator [Tropicimonas sp. IMCC34043]
MKTKRPTLKTISELTGYAVPTVSRALQDAPDIAKRTRQRIQETAREIGYVPNREGVRLRTGMTKTIAMVLGTDQNINEHTGQLVTALAENIEGTGYHLLVKPYAVGADPLEKVRYVVETRLADAIVIQHIEDKDPRVHYMQEMNFPFVTYGRTLASDSHAYFDFDNISFGEIAGNALLDRGRRHILAIAPPPGQAYSRHMVEGLRRAIAGTDAEIDVLEGASSGSPQSQIRASLRLRLEMGSPVDAIVTPSSGAAIAAVAVVELMGRKVGDDFDLFGRESLPFLSIFRPAILTVVENVGLAGEFLAKAVIRAIETPDAPPLQRLERYHLRHVDSRDRH